MRRHTPARGPEGMDRAAKIKVGASVAALVIAVAVLISYFTGFSIFGGNSGPAVVNETPAQQEETKQKIQKLKQEVEEATPPSGRPPVTAGS